MKSEDIIKDSPYKPVSKEVIYFKRETHDSFTIRLDWQLDHHPGQFIFCSLPGIGEAPISICSFSSDYVELNIREVGNVTKALSSIEKGKSLLVRGPYGTSYPMKNFRGHSIVIIGGGCGVAPLKGIINYIEKHKFEYKDIKLFFGFRSVDDILFKSSIPEWQENFNLEVSFDKIVGDTCFNGSQGFITEQIKKSDISNDNTIVFICGPPIMIEKTAEILLDKNFKDDQIFISAERLMYCGMGKCGRCMIHGKYTCIDGAVFRFDELKDFKDD